MTSLILFKQAETNYLILSQNSVKLTKFLLPQFGFACKNLPHELNYLQGECVYQNLAKSFELKYPQDRTASPLLYCIAAVCLTTSNEFNSKFKQFQLFLFGS